MLTIICRLMSDETDKPLSTVSTFYFVFIIIMASSYNLQSSLRNLQNIIWCLSQPMMYREATSATRKCCPGGRLFSASSYAWSSITSTLVSTGLIKNQQIMRYVNSSDRGLYTPSYAFPSQSRIISLPKLILVYNFDNNHVEDRSWYHTACGSHRSKSMLIVAFEI